MKHVPQLRVFLAIFLLFVCITFSVSAFTVASVYVTPRGDQPASTPMTVTAVIDFASRGGTETFPAASELQMSTGLADPHWYPVLVVDGVKTNLTEQSGKVLILPGWYLSYPAKQTAQLRVTLTGKIPATRSPGQDILQVQELDSGARVVSTAHLEMPAEPVLAPAQKTTTPSIFTPIPTDTPSQKSPLWAGYGIIAILGVLLHGIKRR